MKVCWALIPKSTLEVCWTLILTTLAVNKIVKEAYIKKKNKYKANKWTITLVVMFLITFILNTILSSPKKEKKKREIICKFIETLKKVTDSPLPNNFTEQKILNQSFSSENQSYSS